MAGKIRHAGPLMAAIVAACVLGGCNGRPYVTGERLDKGLVMILPGIEGPSVWNASIRKGLYDGGVPYALVIYNWHRWTPGFAYTFSRTAQRNRARQMAAYVGEYRREHPQGPVFVVGHSAGGAMAVMLAEEMVGGEPLSGTIAIAPALSPEYDISKAIEGSGDNIANCCARNDTFLRTLTSLGQNMDGRNGRTAGQDGFRLPESAGDERRGEFGDLLQIRWDPSMKAEGNRGGHFGWTSASWVAGNLAPLVKEWAAEREAARVARGAAESATDTATP